MIKTSCKILNAVKYVGYSIFIIGIAIFLYGLFASDYIVITSVGIGIMMAAFFIFIIGIFFVATEEMDEKTDKGFKNFH